LAKSFRDLEVWQKSVDLTEKVYRVTWKFPKSEMYALSSQMQRAAVSIASNLAEGSARGSKKDFRQFVYVAKGSNCELQTQLLIANRLRLAPEAEIAEAEMLSHEIGRMLGGLSRYLTTQIKAKRAERLS
jgi:four helix bundle protein